MATPKPKTEDDLAIAELNHDALSEGLVPLPEELRYPDKQPQAAAYIIHTYVPEQAMATREELLFIWAGYTGAKVDPSIRQLIQAVDILSPRS